ncbi:hypothetical protein DL93DRAFT_2168150 [Clavulina sp. PMI_390]|nr:hypothetical protein DL93DRAFT_2168150 [Clavulina sp. PMI_390]
MLRLPFELIAQIFGYVALAEELDQSALQRAMQLASISKYLRDIVIASPSLWTRIVVAPSSVRPSCAESEALIFQTILARSGGLPLSLTVRMNLMTDIELYKIFPLIKSAFPQCRHLQLVDLAHLHDFILFPLADTLPHLVSLSITFHNPTSANLFQRAGLAPRLRSLQLWHADIASLGPLALEGLINLELKSDFAMEGPKLAPFLGRCESLTHLRLRHRTKVRTAYPASPILLPNLISLIAPDCRYHSMFTMPKLKHLGCVGTAGEMSQSHLPNLERVTLEGITSRNSFAWGDVPWLLTIHTLGLVDVRSLDRVIEATLSRSSGPGHPWRLDNLQTIMIKLDPSFMGIDLRWFGLKVLRIFQRRRGIVIQCEQEVIDKITLVVSELEPYQTRLAELTDPLIRDW